MADNPSSRGIEQWKKKEGSFIHVIGIEKNTRFLIRIVARQEQDDKSMESDVACRRWFAEWSSHRLRSSVLCWDRRNLSQQLITRRQWVSIMREKSSTKPGNTRR